MFTSAVLGFGLCLVYTTVLGGMAKIVHEVVTNA